MSTVTNAKKNWTYETDHFIRPLPDNVDRSETVEEARVRMEASLFRAGEVLDPITGYKVEIRERPLNPAILKYLVRIYHATATQSNVWIRSAALLAPGGDYAKLTGWGLIEKDPKGGHLWRITQKGIDFVEGRTQVDHKLLVFDSKRVGYVKDKMVSFKDVAGDNFDSSSAINDPKFVEALKTGLVTL